MTDEERDLQHNLSMLTDNVTEVGHWNNEPAGSWKHQRFLDAAEELSDALYDAWLDGKLMIRPAASPTPQFQKAARWGLSLDRAEYYGWRWCLHVGPVIVWMGQATSTETPHDRH